MNSSAEAQVLRRGVAPKIVVNAVTPAWLDAQMAKWIAKQSGPTFEPFDTFDQSSADHIKELTKADEKVWHKYYSPKSVDCEPRKPKAQIRHLDRPRCREKISEADTRNLQALLLTYLRTTNTTPMALARGNNLDSKGVYRVSGKESKQVLVTTRDDILKAMKAAPLGYEKNGKPKVSTRIMGKNQ